MDKSTFSEGPKKFPQIFQGGMGIAVSGYRLARTVSQLGELGVVSGTALDSVMVARLQRGDSTGEIRQALEKFPDKKFASQIIDDYWVEGGVSMDKTIKGSISPQFIQGENKTISLKDDTLEKLLVVANFVEVSLAKEGHNNPVGINWLKKIEWTMLPSIYGAMLAEVDMVLIGAGLPEEVPDILEAFSKGDEAVMPLTVYGGEGYTMRFNPKKLFGNLGPHKKPFFTGIVSNNMGVRKLFQPDGHVYEGFEAGGHNAPPRNRKQKLTKTGEPNFGEDDKINFEKLGGILDRNAKTRSKLAEREVEKEVERKVERQPYWLAGNYTDKLKEALKLGAAGIQVGTPFAFCRESDLESNLKRESLSAIINGAQVYTSPTFSPAGFPFKILQVPGTHSSQEIYRERKRVCDRKYLINFVERNGKVITRCPAEPFTTFINKGGTREDAENRGCLCNGLLANIDSGLSVTADCEFYVERPMVTAGSGLEITKQLAIDNALDYTAEQVIDRIYECAI